MLAVQPCHAEAPPQGLGRICFNREEENGYVNIVPVEVTVGDSDKVTITGGEAACLDVWANAYSIQLEWKWDQRDSIFSTYRSKAQKADLKEGGTETYEICPIASPSDKPDVPWWILAPAGKCGWPE